MSFARGENKDRGFSLVELVIVIVIMAILVGVLAPAYFSYIEKTRRQVDNSAAGEILRAAETIVFSGGFQLDNGDVLVTFDASGINVMQGDVGNALRRELTKDFGDLSTIVPKSKLRRTQTYSVEIQAATEGGGTGTPRIVGSWSGPDE